MRSASSHLLRAASSDLFLSRSCWVLPNTSSAPSSSSSRHSAAKDGLTPCSAATWERVFSPLATSIATAILNFGG
ncbi:hypothetical protein VXJ25_08635 [Olsenella sp. YH-ols2223]|uniref:Secreted protein n=1 Tax=Olsenella absiana TaxID=3115222 RepID=A0ABU7RBR3_9ACTN